MNSLVEYIKIHYISLWQDLSQLEEELEAIEDLNSDEYKFKEVEHISKSGQIIATGHLMSIAKELV